MVNENESLNSLKEEKTTLDEELKTLDSEVDATRITEINERLDPLKDEILTASDEVNKQLFARAKKAEGFVLEDGKWVKKPQADPDPKPDLEPKKELSFEDTYSLIEAKVPRQDIQEVQDYASLKGISVEEALKTGIIKTLLKENQEERKIAEATNVSTSRRQTSKDSPDEILEKAQAGKELPDTDDGIEQLVKASLKNIG